MKEGKFEVIVETIDDILAAAKGGATQLDLKAHYPCSGVSPSAGIIARALHSVEIPVNVMVRPHARSFQWSEGDIETACEEIKQARKLGATNFLTGFLNKQNQLNVEGLKRLKDAVGDCAIHSHLVWELTEDPEQAIEQLIELEFSSLRTGGRSSSKAAFGGDVTDAIKEIKHIKEFVGNRLEIFLAGSINVKNVVETILQTGIINIHCGRGVRIKPTADSPVDQKKVQNVRLKQDQAIKKLH
jgi:copper homeostasis protein